MTATSSHRSPQHRRSEKKETSVLVVALDAPIPAAFSNAKVLVLAPALNSWLRRWVSDEDAARSRAQERVAAWLDRFERIGVHARGRVGDADPLQAIEDASRRDRHCGPVRALDPARRRARSAGASPLRAPRLPCRAAIPNRCVARWPRVGNGPASSVSLAPRTSTTRKGRS